MAAYTTIDNPELYFQVKLYTGDGSTPSITLDGDEDMQPDLVWIKNRDATDAHCLFDAVRGATEVLHADAITAEATDADTLTSFDSDGFALGADVKVNTNTEKYVAWCWKESATAGIDIASYTGNGTADTTITTGFQPEYTVIKCRDQGRHWRNYHHKNSPPTSVNFDTYHNQTVADTLTSFTATGFVLGADDIAAWGVNESPDTYVAYSFKSIQGFSKFGSFESNGNADNVFCYLGFRPALVMTKSIDSTSSWQMFDNKREGYNVDNDALVAEATTAEVTTDYIDLLSNGFKVRTASDPGVAETYIYAAFAEAPFVNSNGVPCNAR